MRQEIRYFRVTDLTISSYNHIQVGTSPVVQANRNGDWNNDAMYHVDAMMSYVGGNNIVAADGRNSSDSISFTRTLL